MLLLALTVLQPAKLKTDYKGLVQGTATTRGDHIAWAGNEEWSAISALAGLVDELVCALCGL